MNTIPPAPAAEQPQGNGLVYGIIDPDYARVFTIARCLAWAEGYALAMHGSFTRDLDLIAIPWTDAACEPEHLARRIEDASNLRITTPGKDGEKPHGRLVWTLKFKTFGDPRFVDLSILPRISAAPSRPVVDEAVRKELGGLVRELRGGRLMVSARVTADAIEGAVDAALGQRGDGNGRHD